MLKQLLIASFTLFGALAAFAIPKPAEIEDATAGDDESDLAIDNALKHNHDRGCGCGSESKGKGKGGK